MPIGLLPHHNRRCTYRLCYGEACSEIYRIPGWRRNSHPYWAVDLTLRELDLRIGGRLIRRAANTVALYSPNLVYEERMEVGARRLQYWVLLEEEGEPSQLAQLTGEKGYYIVSDPAHQFKEAVQEIVALKYPQPARGFLVDRGLYTILGLLFTLEHGEIPTISAEGLTPSVHPWAEAVLEALDQTNGQGITLQEMAARIGVSASTFTHRYRAMCGESFKETILRWRIEKARSLLIGSRASMKEIAASVGYTQTSYFCNQFKAATGLSPSVFRKVARRHL